MDAPFDSTLESDIRELMKDVPPPVRAFFASGKVETIAKSLMLKNQLHLDQGTVVEREIIFLLLGLKSPDEFNQALVTDANLSQQVIGSIVQDVNTQIFSPLREEMRKGVEALGKRPPQIPAAMPVRQQTAAPMPAPAAGADQSTSHFHLENKLPPAPRPIPPATAMSQAPRPSAQVPVAASALGAPVPVLPQQPIKPIPTQSPVEAAPFPQPPRPAVASGVGGPRPLGTPVTPIQPSSVNVLPTESKPAQQIPAPVRPPISNIAPLPPKVVLPSAIGAGFRPAAAPLSSKPMDGSKLLEDHEEPHIELSKNKASSSSSETPLQQALRTVLPPPRNLPGAMPPPDIMPSSRPAPVVQKVSQTPPKPYSADPYREPIE